MKRLIRKNQTPAKGALSIVNRTKPSTFRYYVDEEGNVSMPSYGSGQHTERLDGIRGVATANRYFKPQAERLASWFNRRQDVLKSNIEDSRDVDHLYSYSSGKSGYVRKDTPIKHSSFWNLGNYSYELTPTLYIKSMVGTIYNTPLYDAAAKRYSQKGAVSSGLLHRTVDASYMKGADLRLKDAAWRYGGFRTMKDGEWTGDYNSGGLGGVAQYYSDPNKSYFQIFGHAYEQGNQRGDYYHELTHILDQTNGEGLSLYSNDTTSPRLLKILSILDLYGDRIYNGKVPTNSYNTSYLASPQELSARMLEVRMNLWDNGLITPEYQFTPKDFMKDGKAYKLVKSRMGNNYSPEFLTTLFNDVAANNTLENNDIWLA